MATKTADILRIISNSPTSFGEYNRPIIKSEPKPISCATKEPLKSTLAFLRKSVFNSFNVAKKNKIIVE